jgi:hypothetical protein
MLICEYHGAIIRLEAADTCPEQWLVAGLFYLFLLNEVMLIFDNDVQVFGSPAYKCNYQIQLE